MKRKRGCGLFIFISDAQDRLARRDRGRNKSGFLLRTGTHARQESPAVGALARPILAGNERARHLRRRRCESSIREADSFSGR
jgi:hypothetical protein